MVTIEVDGILNNIRISPDIIYINNDDKQHYQIKNKE